MKLLFVSWDGPQVTYLEGLFLPIFRALQRRGVRVHVLQFTWASHGDIARTQAAYVDAGVGYRAVRVWRHPKALGAVGTAAWGARRISRLVRSEGIDLVMPRSILPAFATMLASGARRAALVFDADGLPIDERVEFAGEPASTWRHKVMREVEVEAVRDAAVVLTRTSCAADILRARAGAGTASDKFQVVGNGRDPAQFHPFDVAARQRVRASLRISADAPLLVYAGSLGAQYCPAEILALFAAVLRLRADAHLLVLTRQGDLLQEYLRRQNLPKDSVTVRALPPDQVPVHLAAADLGLGLRMHGFSMRAVAPIKLGEYLLCGVPVVVSSVVANSELVDARTGIRLSIVDDSALESTARWFVHEVLPDRESFRTRCVALGRSAFSLDASVEGYLHAFATAVAVRGKGGVRPGSLQQTAKGRADAVEKRGPGVLYLSYDGMLEPLGQSQVLAYLEHLAGQRPIHLVSFEKAEDWADVGARDALRARMDAAGIRWHPRRYHKRPSALATGFDISAGTLLALWLVTRHRLRIVHARSYVAGVMALVVTRVTKAKFLFDMRGFWADERLDGGLWPANGRMYRVAKWFERRFLLSADHVVSLTHAAVREMRAFPYLRERLPPISVIPTCADLDRFRPMANADESGFVLGYVGSAGTWYLFDATVACFVELRKQRPDARMLIINRNEHAYIRERLAVGGVEEEAFELRAASHDQIPAQMARMHATAFFIKPVFSKQASAPTKLAEFLGCGIPCLTNAGVGDMAGILEGDGVGVAVKDFSAGSISDGVRKLLALANLPSIREQCVASAQRHFSLARGVKDYEAVYRSLAQGL